VLAFCSACDQPRAPFSSKALTFVGQPAQVGGRIGRAVGVLVLIFGLLLAAAVILFFQLLVPTASIGYAVGLPIALVSLVVGTLLVLVSRRLGRSGADAERRTRLEALHALALHRGGTLTATDAARSLRLEATESEALLRHWAETKPEQLSLEFDDEGQTFYRLVTAETSRESFGVKYRVTSDGKVRVMDALGAEDQPERAIPTARSGRFDR
jgi:hypothetical protein